MIHELNTETNTQAVQNLSNNLDSFLFNYSQSWDKRGSQFLEIAGQLDAVDHALPEKDGRAKFIRTITDSFASVCIICTELKVPLKV